MTQTSQMLRSMDSFVREALASDRVLSTPDIVKAVEQLMRRDGVERPKRSTLRQAVHRALGRGVSAGQVRLIRRGNRRNSSSWSIGSWAFAEVARAGLDRAISKAGQKRFQGVPVGLGVKSGRGGSVIGFRFQRDAGVAREVLDDNQAKGLALIADGLRRNPGVVILYSMTERKGAAGYVLEWAY